jgi:RNA polymerase sigma-70 factor (ECF subfamily)
MFGFGNKKIENTVRRELPQHLDGLFGAAMRLTRNSKDAEDLVQDAITRALRFEDTFHEGTNLKAWLFRILTNTFINKYRRRVRERELLGEMERHELQDSVISEDALEALANPEKDYLSRMVSAEVITALESLTDEYRTVVMLSDVYDFSYAEIAEIVGCPVGTVMSRLFRGRQRLKKALYDYACEQGIITAPASQDESAVSLDEYRAKKSQGAK